MVLLYYHGGGLMKHYFRYAMSYRIVGFEPRVRHYTATLHGHVDCQAQISLFI